MPLKKKQIKVNTISIPLSDFEKFLEIWKELFNIKIIYKKTNFNNDFLSPEIDNNCRLILEYSYSSTHKKRMTNILPSFDEILRRASCFNKRDIFKHVIMQILDRKGYTRSAIAKFLGCGASYVSNTLITPTMLFDNLDQAIIIFDNVMSNDENNDSRSQQAIDPITEILISLKIQNEYLKDIKEILMRLESRDVILMINKRGDFQND